MAKAATHYLADLLAPWGAVEIKRMFGGLGAWRDGIFFALIADDIVYFKVDQTTRPDYARLQSEAFSYRIVKYGVTNLKIIDSLWRVPEEILEYPDALAAWAQKAFDIARLKPDKATKKVEARGNSLHGLNGLGPKSLRLIKTINIASIHDLQTTGAIDAYRQLKARYPKEVSLNLLWDLYAVLNGIEKTDVTPDIKDHLKALLNVEAS